MTVPLVTGRQLLIWAGLLLGWVWLVRQTAGLIWRRLR